MASDTYGNELPWKLTPAEMARFQETGHGRSYPGTEKDPAAILIADDPPTHVVLILEGRVKITKSSHADGREVLLGTRGEGELVGEIAVIDRRPRSATVWTAGGPVKGSAMHADEFEKFLRANPAIMWRLLVSQVRAVREADDRLAASRTPAESRVIWCLKHECEKQMEARHDRRPGEAVIVSLSRTDLARLAMVSIGVVSRALQGPRTEGLIAPGRNRYIILKPEELLQY
jgi:CRP/FNR family cyclic AMP-dependent transcriptional regulator